MMFKRWEKIKQYLETGNILITIFLVLLVFIFYLFYKIGLLERLELLTYDLKVMCAISDQRLKPDSDIVIVNIDDDSFKKLDKLNLEFNRWPWPTEVMLEGLEFINESKPRAILYRFSQNTKLTPERDKKVIDVLSKFKCFYGYLAIENIKYFTLLNIQKALINKTLSPCSYLNLDKSACEELQKSKTTDEIERMIFDNEEKNNIPMDYIPEHLSVKVNHDKVNDNSSLMDSITFLKHSNIVESYAKNYKKIGVSYYLVDSDDITRCDRPLYRYVKDSKFYASMSFIPFLDLWGKDQAILSDKYIETANKIIPIDNRGRVAINFRYNYSHYPRIDFLNCIINRRILKNTIKQSKEDLKQFIIDKNLLKDKIVIVGMSSGDKYSSDLLSVPGGKKLDSLQFIAIALDNYINCGPGKHENFISNVSWPITMLITLIFCLLNIGLIIKFTNIYAKIPMIFVGVGFYLLCSFHLFVVPGYRFNLPVILPIFIMLFTSLCTFFIEYNTVYKKRKEIEGLFGKFVSPQVKKILLDDPSLINYEGHKKELTVLFTDLRDFTTISETYPTHQIMNLLNEYFSEMANIIVNEYNGTLDKFMGDAIMAFWGDPIPQENHAELAIKAAFAMNNKLNELNAKWDKIGWPKLKMGIGINTGEMTVGHLGGGILVDYTVIGDNVNIASRLESLNKEYNTSILITENTYMKCKDKIQVHYIDEKIVKGKREAVKIYEVLSILAT